MNERPDLEAAQRWMRGALRELRAARLLGEDHELAASARFHAHLAAEKALKALLVAGGRAVRKTHNLLDLHRLLAQEHASGFDSAELAELNPWAIESRYDDEALDLSPVVTERAINLAKQVVIRASAYLGVEIPEDA